MTAQATMRQAATPFEIFRPPDPQEPGAGQDRADLPRGDLLISRLKLRNLIDIDGATVEFRSNTWDFQDAYEYPRSDGDKRLHFPEGNPFCDLIKLFAYDRLVKTDVKTTTLASIVRHLSRFLGKAAEQGASDISDIPYSFYQSFWEAESRRITYSTCKRRRYNLLEMLYFYERLFRPIPDRRVVKLLSESDPSRMKAERMAGKTPAIPTPYLEEFLAECMRVAKDEAALLDDRIIACCLLMYSQIGCRTEELGTFKAGGARVVPGEGRGRDLWFTEFLHGKNKSAPRGKWVPTSCYMNALSLEAFRMLEGLCRDLRELKGVPDLVVFSNGSLLTASTFSARYKPFLFRNAARKPFLGAEGEHPTLRCIAAQKAASAWFSAKGEYARGIFESSGLGEKDVFFYPTVMMFRNTVCTTLYSKKVSLEWVRRHLNHLHSDMTAYYNRADADINEAFSNEVYEAILVRSARLMGLNADRLTGRIQKFIASRGAEANSRAGMEETVAAVARRYPLRLKYGGICIRCAQVAPCPADDRTDEILCAYGACPNQCFLYYMAPIAYHEAAAAAAIVDANMANGHVKAARHELSKLHRIIKTALAPELGELRREIESRGVESVLDEHPDLVGIADRMDEVEEEVRWWSERKI